MRNKFTNKNFLLVLVICFTMPFLAEAQTLNNFPNPLPIPPKESITASTTFAIDGIETTHNFDPNGFLTSINLNVNIPTYAYNKLNATTPSTFLGPTLVVKKGDPIIFDVLNDLSSVNTSFHFNGLNTPSFFGPHNEIAPNAFEVENFTVIDPVKTASYHPLLFDGKTNEQLSRGLAGMIFVEDVNDPIQAVLPTGYGQNDFPIIIQEKQFELNNMTTPPTATSIITPTSSATETYATVNGVVGGYLRVPPEQVRLRILNASSITSYHIGLSTEINNPTNFSTMNMIATRGGYLDNPKAVEKTVLSMGDCREFMVDFSQWADGDTVYMIDLSVPTDFDSPNSVGKALMAFVVDDSLFPNNPIFSIPTTLNTSYGLAPGMVTKTKTKSIDLTGNEYLIDGAAMDAVIINDTILVNSKESWTITNDSDLSIPFAMSKVDFQVVSYNGKVGAGDIVESHTSFSTMPEELQGYKNVQLLRAGASMMIEMNFDSFPSPLEADKGYMYYSSRLDLDKAMHQFVVTLTPPPVFASVGMICTNTTPNDLGGATPTGGVYSGSNVTDNGNGETFTFDAAAAGVGTHTITYTVSGQSVNATVEVVALPAVTLTLNANYFVIDGVLPAGIGGGSPSGGVYSDPYNEITDDGNGMTFGFNSTAMTGFANSITYTYIDPVTGCTNSASQDVFLGTMTDVDDLDKVNLEIFPNPTTGIINLRGAQTDRIEVIDIHGKVLRVENTPSNTLDISNFPSGIYFLRINVENQIVTQRVIKE